jgi:hypothetical protein
MPLGDQPWFLDTTFKLDESLAHRAKFTNTTVPACQSPHALDIVNNMSNEHFIAKLIVTQYIFDESMQGIYEIS